MRQKYTIKRKIVHRLKCLRRVSRVLSSPSTTISSFFPYDSDSARRYFYNILSIPTKSLHLCWHSISKQNNRFYSAGTFIKRQMIFHCVNVWVELAIRLNVCQPLLVAEIELWGCRMTKKKKQQNHFGKMLAVVCIWLALSFLDIEGVKISWRVAIKDNPLKITAFLLN